MSEAKYTLYRCGECHDLDAEEPELANVLEWNPTFESWKLTTIRICRRCRSRARSAYRPLGGNING